MGGAGWRNPTQRSCTDSANGQSTPTVKRLNFPPGVPIEDAEYLRPMLIVAIILATLCLLIGSEEFVRPAAIRRKRRDD